MKRIQALTLFCLSLSLAGKALAQNQSSVIDHSGLTLNSANGEVISSLGTHLVPNADIITKFDHNGNVIWTNHYSADGREFIAWESLDYFPDLVFLGAVEHRQNVLMKTNHQGQVIWTRRYSEEFHEMVESYNGDIVLARGDASSMPSIHLAEVSITDGSILNRVRVGFQGIPSGDATVVEIERSPRGYFLIVKAGGHTFSATVDHNLNPLDAKHITMPNGDELVIKDILKSDRGDFYFLGTNPTWDRMLVGRINDQHVITEAREIEISSDDIEFELSASDSRITESQNLTPYHSEQTTNYLNIKAVTFVAGIRDRHTNWQREFVIQFNEFFYLNCATAFNVNPALGLVSSVQIHQKQNNRLVVNSTIGTNGSQPRLITHFLADDHAGCFAEAVVVCLTPVNLSRNDLIPEILEGDLGVESMDGNIAFNNFGSLPQCTTAKTTAQEDPAEAELNESPIRIYPNPSAGQVYVEAPAGAGIQVADLQGRIIHHLQNQANGRIALPELAHGLYIVKVQAGARVTQKKLVVE